MAKQYKDTLKQLGDRLKSEPVQTPIQEVRPVVPTPAPSDRRAVATTSADERLGKSHVNFWVPDELMERLKLHAVKSKKKIKQIGYEALDAYLPKLG